MLRSNAERVHELLASDPVVARMIIEDAISTVRENDLRWVQRFLTRLPNLAQAREAQRKARSQYSDESGNDEIAPLFETVLRKR